MFKKNRIYSPLYNMSHIPSDVIPDIYNIDGKKMDIFFLRDIHWAHNPYGDSSKYFLWDRYNYGLKTHVYTHNAMLETMGQPTRKYGMLIESSQIVPKDYNIFKRHKGLEQEFDAIFTYHDQLLNELQNSKFFPGCAGVWYGKKNKDIRHPNQYQNKEKDISIVSSDKVMCELHKVRIEIARYCKRNNLADTFGTFDNGNYVSIEDSLQDYRYSFAIENDITDYFFTEKITNCFASQTIPIYLGARKIDQFFNPDGIIKISKDDVHNIDYIVNQCTKEEYERRLPAILDNYNRVQQYINIWDYFYLNFTNQD